MTTTSTRSGSACSTAARSTAWSLRCGSRRWCSPTRSPEPTRNRPTWARAPPPSSRSPASRWPRWASPSRSGRPTSTSSFSEPKRGVYKSVVIRDDKIIGATLFGDSPQGRVPAAGLRPRAAAAGGAGLAAVRPRWAERRRSGSPRWPTTPRSATATASARATSAAAVHGGCKIVGAVMDKTRAGKGCGSCKGAGGPDRRVRRRRRGRGGPGRALLRARHPDGQAGSDGGHPGAGPALTVRGLRRAGPRGRRGRQVARWAWPRC